MTDARYDAWLVDLDGTLYTQRWVRLAMAIELALFGRAAIKTLRQFRHEHEALRAEQNSGRDLAQTHSSPFAGQLARTAEQLGKPVAEVELVVRSWMVERPGKWIRRFARHALLNELRAFKAQGGRTALVSDYPAERKIDSLGARSLFDVIVANGEEHGPRRLKPDPEGYLRAAELLQVEPARCLVIGDRDDADGGAARAAKMSFRLV
ncbi:MAG TPA: HAD family hydrolase [Polyangiaceae bacterium]|nr:HAD family hydrolase [Polyangiaceae bacterium]